LLEIRVNKSDGFVNAGKGSPMIWHAFHVESVLKKMIEV